MYTTPHARRSPWLPTHAAGNVKHRILAKRREKPGEQAAQTARARGDAAERTTRTGLKLFSGMPMPHVKHGKGEVRRPAALRSVPSDFLPPLRVPARCPRPFVPPYFRRNVPSCAARRFRSRRNNVARSGVRSLANAYSSPVGLE